MKKIYVIKEGLFESIMKDLVTFSCLIIAMYANYNFCGNSNVMSGFFIIMMFMKAANYWSDNHYELEEAKEIINKLT